MAIQVICTGCHKRFKVSDSYAGQTGPCPNCKAPIRVPAKGEEVKVHEAYVTDGERTLRPLTREKSKLTVQLLGIIVASVLGVFLLTALLQVIGLTKVEILGHPVFAYLGLLAVSVPIAFGGYELFRNEEMTPFDDRSIWTRSTICGVVYALTWFVFVTAMGFVSGGLTPELWMWAAVVPPLVIIGGFTSKFSFDLDFGAACFHYGVYLLLTVSLRWAAGFGWIWQIGVAAATGSDGGFDPYRDAQQLYGG